MMVTSRCPDPHVRWSDELNALGADELTVTDAAVALRTDGQALRGCHRWSTQIF